MSPKTPRSIKEDYFFAIDTLSTWAGDTAAMLPDTSQGDRFYNPRTMPANLPENQLEDMLNDPAQAPFIDPNPNPNSGITIIDQNGVVTSQRIALHTLLSTEK